MVPLYSHSVCSWYLPLSNLSYPDIDIIGDTVDSHVIAEIDDIDAIDDVINCLFLTQVRPVNVTSPSDSKGSSQDWSDIEPQVTHIAFNNDGTTMVTIDVRPDASTTQSYTTSLKFWERRASGDAASGTPLYHIHTQIDNPHR